MMRAQPRANPKQKGSEEIVLTNSIMTSMSIGKVFKDFVGCQ